jgi:hypothetical protein
MLNKFNDVRGGGKKTCVFVVETWFALNRNMNNSNDRYQCFKNPPTFLKFLTPIKLEPGVQLVDTKSQDQCLLKQ